MQELESGAVATLREISDYPFLFDQKIGELQRLYQSLEVKEAIQQTKKTQLRMKRSKDKPKIILHVRGRQPSRVRIRCLDSTHIKQQRTKNKPVKYRSLNKALHDMREMYNKKSLEQQASQEKSKRLSSTRHDLNSSRQNNSVEETSNGTQSKQLQHLLYQKLKISLLNSFVIDGTPLGAQTTRENVCGTTEPFQSIGDSTWRSRRGRLWQGRPPARIIELYN